MIRLDECGLCGKKISDIKVHGRKQIFADVSFNDSGVNILCGDCQRTLRQGHEQFVDSLKMKWNLKVSERIAELRALGRIILVESP